MTKFSFFKIILIVLISVILLACSNPANDLKERRVVAISNPQLIISRATPLTWYADFKIHSGTEKPTVKEQSDKFEFTQLIQQQIEQEIIGKGFNFNTKPQITLKETQYQVVALAVAGDNITSSEYLDLFNLFPELSYDSDLSEGTLIVAIVDPVQKKAAWRGSVQILLEPNLDKKTRIKRISTSVTKLLKSLKPTE